LILYTKIVAGILESINFRHGFILLKLWSPFYHLEAAARKRI